MTNKRKIELYQTIYKAYNERLYNLDYNSLGICQYIISYIINENERQLLLEDFKSRFNDILTNEEYKQFKPNSKTFTNEIGYWWERNKEGKEIRIKFLMKIINNYK